MPASNLADDWSTVPASADFDWVVLEFGRAACVTAVSNGDTANVLEAFGADVSILVDEDEQYAHEGRYDAVVAAYAVPGGVIAFEGNGFQGSLHEVVSRLANAGGRVASMYWNEDAAMPRLTCAEGTLVSSTSLFDFGEVDRDPDHDDPLPSELAALAEELRSVDFDAADSHERMMAIGFAMMAQFSGVSVPRTIFAGPPPPAHPIPG